MPGSNRGLWGVVLFYGAIGVNYWLFQILFDTNYLLWYLSQGAFISISIALLSAIVNELDRDTDLLSTHPRHYYAGCLWVLVMVISSMKTNFRVTLLPAADDTDKDARASTGSTLWEVISGLWDAIVGLAVTGLVWLVVLLWFVIVAPIQYAVFVVACAPVRMGLGGQPLYVAYKVEDDPETHQPRQVIEETTTKPTNTAVDMTFTRKPVAMTFAIAAVLLWLANTALVPLM